MPNNENTPTYRKAKDDALTLPFHSAVHQRVLCLTPHRALFLFFLFPFSFWVCLSVCRSVEERLLKRPFDDWTLGNSDSQLSEEGFEKRIRGREEGGSFDDWRLGNSDSPMQQARVREENSRMSQARVWKGVKRRFHDDSRECRKDFGHACPQERF